MNQTKNFSSKLLITAISTSLLAAVVSGCSTTQQAPVQTQTPIMATNQILNETIATYQQGTSLPYSPLLQVKLAKSGEVIEIRNSGYGSDAVAHPTNLMQFYALTDRGPNANSEGALGEGKMFPTPDYTPRIGLFELTQEGKIIKIKDILLKDTSGKPISGLPNQANFGGTGETPYDVSGNPILVDSTKPFNKTTNPTKTDNFGLDGEGLVALKDGTFWVSDEYGPHIVHFDATGKEIGRINAFADDARNNLIVNQKQVLLPAEFANRRANRGMEGLAITPDETTLVGIMQSTMDNPTKAVRKQDITRIVTINLQTGKVSQYLYKQEKAQNSNSGIVALDNHNFLVIERDGGFELQKPGVQKHIYKISLNGATDLESIKESKNIQQNDKLGLMLSGKTVEQYLLDITALNKNSGWDTLIKSGIQPVSKKLVLDAVKAFNYPHDKLEGLWLMGDGRLGLLNDDDFATWSTDGVLEQKQLDKTKTNIDSNRLYIATGVEY